MLIFNQISMKSAQLSRSMLQNNPVINDHFFIIEGGRWTDKHDFHLDTTSSWKKRVFENDIVLLGQTQKYLEIFILLCTFVS